MCFASVAEEIVCPPPPEDFPEVKLVSNTTTEARYKCAEGYEQVGGKRVIQCSGGQWKNLTLQCQKKPCGSAGELLNGYFQYEGEPVLGDTASVVCDEGYTVKGPAVIECGVDGWPQDLPTCEEGTVTCSAPKVANSETKDFAHEYKVSEVLTLRCSPGFQMKGAAKISCGSDGEWEPPLPQCVPSPAKPGNCSAPGNTEIPNVMLLSKYDGPKSFSAGSKIYYKCHVGYVPAKGYKYRTCKQGRWSPLKLRCKRKLCGTAGELYNGHYVYNGTEFGDTATAVCDEGFQLVGHARRNCLSNGWNEHPPSCEAVSCDDPPDVLNAERVDSSEAPFEYRTVVTYRCLMGSLIGSPNIWCRANRTWSTPLPQCKDITCEPPNISNAWWVRSERGHYQLHDTIYIQCESPYTISGRPAITCGFDGQWYPPVPKCRRKDTLRFPRRG